MMYFREEFEWGDPFYAIFVNKMFGKRQKSTVFKQKSRTMKKFVLKNSETRFQKAETRFQKAETRFQNAKTPLSRIFLARTWMDSAQKKPEETHLHVGHKPLVPWRLVPGLLL